MLIILIIILIFILKKMLSKLLFLNSVEILVKNTYPGCIFGVLE